MLTITMTEYDTIAVRLNIDAERFNRLHAHIVERGNRAIDELRASCGGVIPPCAPVCADHDTDYAWAEFDDTSVGVVWENNGEPYLELTFYPEHEGDDALDGTLPSAVMLSTRQFALAAGMIKRLIAI